MGESHKKLPSFLKRKFPLLRLSFLWYNKEIKTDREEAAMLIPILGRAGSGKTAWVLDKIKQTAEEGGRVLLIVPEQFSFEMEKEVFGRLGGSLAMQVEVYSFTRLCHRVFSECGGAAGEYVTDAARQILMSLALGQVKDQLELYSRQAKSASFIGTMLRQVDEFKNAGIDHKRLHDFSENTGLLQLAQKTKEMSLIYEYYQALLSNRFQDEKDSIMKCCSLLEGRGYFKGCTIFIDSFMTFMAGEKKLMRLMLSECQDLYLSMPADGIGSQNTPEQQSAPIGDGTFDTARETVLQLIRDAKEMGVEVKTPLILQNQYRFQNEELRFLERWLPSVYQTEFEGENHAVSVMHAPNPYEEVRYLAAQIVKLVRQENLRYSQIAVIARNADSYLTAIEDIFPKYHIPFFLDMREDVQSIPVFSLLFSALDALESNFDTQHMLSLGKNPLMGLAQTKIAQLENYCFLWGVDHRMWLEQQGFENNPRGMVESFTDKDRETLEEIHETALAITQPLKSLGDKLQNCTGREFAQAIYDFLLEVGAKQRLEESADSLCTTEEQQRSLRLNQGAWDILMDLLDVFCHVLEEISLPLKQLHELFSLAALSSDIGSIPNTLDQVSIGSADRMRPNQPKVTIVIGANQGEFPPQLSENGLFSETERDRLLESGIQLNPSVLKLSGYEKYYVYSALTSASDRLIVTSHTAKLTGEATPDSSIVAALAKMFPNCVHSTGELPEEFYIANEQTAFETLCRNIRSDTPFTAALMEYVRTTRYAPQLEQVLAMVHSGGFRMKNREISRMLFGSRMRLSPSRVERYFTCPFAYFCSGGLNLQARRKVEISPMQSGTIIHFVMERMVRTHGGKGLQELSWEQMQQEVESLLREFLEQRVSRSEALSKRFHYLFERLSITLTRLLRQLAKEFAQSEFEPVRFELPIRQGGEVAPLELRLDDSTQISVEGIVDRVDLMEKDGRKYVRVVDYKSGSKVFKLDDVYYGLNLQMLIYLFSIWKNGKGELADCLPAGVLYLPAKDHIITAARESTDEEIEREHQKKYKMNGLVLEDPVCVAGMEQKISGVFIPVKTKSDGSFDARSSLAGLEQMGQIQRHIERILTEMAQNLQNGSIEAIPAAGLGYEPCKYCDYKPICQHQTDDKKKTLKELDREQFFDLIQKEGGDQGAR